MKKRFGFLLYILSSLLIAATSVYVGYLEEEEIEKGTFFEKSLNFVIDMPKENNRHRLIVGYNYELLKSFGRYLDSEVTIINNYDQDVDYVDSLLAGTIDMIVLPYKDTVVNDSIYFSLPIDSLTVWAVKSDKPGVFEEMEVWLELFEGDSSLDLDKSPFMNRFNPERTAERGRTLRRLSPYDGLIKQYAKSLGWDWRMLAALIYQESRFHIEAHSRRGAKGLMQMMPSTMEHYGCHNPLDPEESIKAGTKYLRRLERMFSDYAISDDELCKFTLAAYNAGEGRIQDCITYAKYKGNDTGTWSGILEIIPEMREDDILEVEGIKLGKFRGYETTNYVESVLRLYNQFCQICP